MGLALSIGVLARAQQSDEARDLHRRALVVDTHVDTAQRMIYEPGFDLGRRHADGQLDLPRMKDGGLDAVFFSIWTPSETPGDEAVLSALAQIDAVQETARRLSKDVVLATSVADIRRASGDGQIAMLLGLEGGHMIADDLGLLRTYARLGVRYMTLTHNGNTHWADASRSEAEHGGLTGFGRDVVREMNRLGMMVDVSHVSDETFADVLEVTEAPVIASHSSCRAIADHPRNMSDDMLRTLARNGGVVMINYFAAFLSGEFNGALPSVQGEIDAALAACARGNEACTILTEDRVNKQLMLAGRLPRVGWEAILDHIDHAVKVAGIDHVGLGSDFDGASMPIGMEDVSMLPKITQGLLARGYSEGDVQKILGENLLRVMGEVEARRTAP
jgi:membrane dipeptidase